MLPKSFRLSTAQDFTRIFREGRFANDGELSIQWIFSAHLTTPQVGFIASKKNFPEASARNRAKRLLREALRPNLFQLRQGFAMIVLYRYKPQSMEYTALTRRLHTLLLNNNLLTPRS
jgi:ribonuclease P protein component